MENKKIILGTVQMGLLYGINNTTGRVSFDESQNILSNAYHAGIRILDTAETYGNAHQIIGNFHRLNPSNIFNVITKIPPSDNLIDIEDRIVRYLNELSVSHIEGLMFHSFQSYINHKGSFAKLIKLKKDGFFKQLGVSIYTNDELHALLKDDEIDLIQLPFNLLDNFTIRGELMLEAKRKGKTIHTRSAFLQGLLFKNPMDKHPMVQALQHQLLTIQDILSEQGTSMTSLALGYCLSQSCIDQVLIGVDSVKQLETNLEASNYQIDKKLIQRINEIQTDNLDLLNPSLWDMKVLN